MNERDASLIREHLSHEPDLFRRGLLLIGYLGKFLAERNMPLPRLVGGAVVEIFTRGSYKTSDFDIVHGNKREIIEFLRLLGFDVMGVRNAYSEELDIHLDLLQEPVRVGQSHPRSFLTIQLSDESGAPLYVDLLTLEDIILDRLNAAAWWGGENPVESADFLWAATMLSIGGDEVDVEYLREQVEAEQEPSLSCLLGKMFEKSRHLRSEENGVDDHGEPENYISR